MYSSRDPQSLDVCPYNASHRILKFRMATHLVKCRKAYQGENPMTACLFNATHSIAEAEKKYHHENCPDRFNLDKQVLISKDVNTSKFPVQSVEVTNEENWDEENCPTYQPEEYCRKNAILRQAKVESAATRKNFRIAERHRIQLLKDDPSSPSGNVIQPASQSKFRSTALANTTTNVIENEPFSYEDLERMKFKPVMTIPNQVAEFVGAKCRDESKSEEDSDTDSFGAQAASLPSSDDVELPKKDADDNGFVTQKSKRKVGRGRGRGVTH